MGTPGNCHVIGNNPFNVENTYKHTKGSCHACGFPQVPDEFLEYFILFIPLMWCTLKANCWNGVICKILQITEPLCFLCFLRSQNHPQAWFHSLGPFHMPQQKMLVSEGLSNLMPIAINRCAQIGLPWAVNFDPRHMFINSASCATCSLTKKRGQLQRWIL